MPKGFIVFQLDFYFDFLLFIIELIFREVFANN